MSEFAQGSDDALLAERRPGLAGAAFAVFYGRHERAVLAYFRRRVPTAEMAADLTAETFAQALASRRRYAPRGDGSASGWLFAIAAHVLARSARRGRTEDRARRRLGIAPLALDDQQLELIERLGADDGVMLALEGLPPEQRDAVRARIVEEQSYAQIAAAAGASQSAIRKRVSRGLAALRNHLEESA